MTIQMTKYQRRRGRHSLRYAIHPRDERREQLGRDVVEF